MYNLKIHKVINSVKSCAKFVYYKYSGNWQNRITMVPLNTSSFERIQFSEDSLLLIFLETHIPLFSSKYQILSKCRFKKFQLVFLVPNRQPVLNLFSFFNESPIHLGFAWGEWDILQRSNFWVHVCTCIVNLCNLVLNYNPNVTMSMLLLIFVFGHAKCLIRFSLSSLWRSKMRLSFWGTMEVQHRPIQITPIKV